jgi:FixJ family two-component response regulator
LAHPPVISIIDDDGSVRTATYNLVRTLGYVVHTFESAGAFLQSPHLHDTSCVIADIQMPVMTGLELQAHLVADGYRLPFIFITAFATENARMQALKAGASCFLTKPFTGEALINCLDAALHGHGEKTSG